ncbi:MAG: hypothetical protein QW667_00660 [Candidatus Bathyarchaeia archaeon]
MSHQQKLTPDEIRLLHESLNSNYRVGNIRLREGEYQYEFAKVIASFQLELRFPDVKDIIRRLYGEEKAEDIQFIRKVQTILKKMEKANVIKILPKRRPWELQRYALLSFKFQDSEKNFVTFATDQQINQTQMLLRSLPIQERSRAKLSHLTLEIYVVAASIIILYMVIVWGSMQPIINPILFVIAFSIATIFSVMLGKLLSRS